MSSVVLLRKILMFRRGQLFLLILWEEAGVGEPLVHLAEALHARGPCGLGFGLLHFALVGQTARLVEGGCSDGAELADPLAMYCIQALEASSWARFDCRQDQRWLNIHAHEAAGLIVQLYPHGGSQKRPYEPNLKRRPCQRRACKDSKARQRHPHRSPASNPSCNT